MKTITIEALQIFLLFTLALICATEGADHLRGGGAQSQSQQVNETELEHQIITELSERMRPRSLHLGNGGSEAAEARQFFHLHHMKSGGTSLDQWIGCALQRQRHLDLNLNAVEVVDNNTNTSTNDEGRRKGSSRTTSKEADGKNKEEPLYPNIKSARLSECSTGSYNRCISDEGEGNCRARYDDAATMTYCSPLAVVNYFDWSDADAVTMMRHPVDRVWSMFRFRTGGCYKCKDLKTVYRDMDNGDVEEYGKGICLGQLSNHISRNLLKKINVKELDSDESMTEDEKLEDAIDSIKNSFTVVGILAQLEESLEMMSYSFPWLSAEIEGSDMTCEFPHSNASPHNNCGSSHPEESEDGRHWDLPSHPDDETRKLIEEHNQIDMKVYEAALAHFELQKLAMIATDEEDTE
jgi:hypothetical protein